MDAQNLPASGDRTGSGNVRTRSYYGAREGERFLQASTISLVLGKALSSREKKFYIINQSGRPQCCVDYLRGKHM